VNAEIFATDGKFLMLALDHLGSFRRLIDPDNPNAVPKETIIALKSQIIAPLVGRFSGILLDSAYGLPAYKRVLKEGGLKNPPPFLLRIEETGYEGDEQARYTRIGYSVSELKNAGAAGIKLLLPFNPSAESAGAQIEMGRKVLNEAHNGGLPLFLEIITYGGREPFPSYALPTAKSGIILSSVKIFLENDVVPDVWKLEYPGDAESCQKLTAIVGGTPWILLTRGAKFENFKEHLKIAVAHGCGGFLAGRALWQDLIGLPKQEPFPSSTLATRFRALSKIVRQ
jgi:tagatose 1,6-diphosphate aldolase